MDKHMSAGLQGATSHTTKLIDSFAHNLNRLEAALYNIDGRIERTQDNLAKLRLDHAEAQKLVLGPILRLEPLSLTVPFFVLLYVVVGTRRI